MKKLLSLVALFIGLCTMMGCGPSKAEIEAQRRADSARLVDSVRSAERQRIADSIHIADSIRATDSIAQANLMNQIESTYNKIARDWEDGAKAIISRYGTAKLKNTYAKYGSSSGIEACYLLKVDYTDGYMTIKGKSVNRINDNSCQMNYKTYYNGPEDVEDYGTATLTMVRENGTWLIDDIEEDGYNVSFMKDPKAYRHYAP